MPDNPKPSKASKGGLLSKVFRSHPTAPNIGNAVFLAGLSGVAAVDKASTLSSVLEQMPNQAVDLNVAKTGLTLLCTLGEGFTGIPALKAVATIALEIVTAVETAQNNKDACRATALRVYQTIHAIAKGSQDGREGIESHVGELENDLSKILDIILTLTSHKPHAQVLQGATVAQELTECDRLLTHAITLFSVKVQIHQANVQSQQMTSLTKIVRKLDNPDGETLLSNLLVTTSLPPPPTHFVGRDDLVDEGVNHIVQSPTAARIAILGQGGIGKTTLSLAILHHKSVKEFFNSRRFFLPCETLKTGHDLILGVLQVLGVPSLGSKQDPLDFLHKQLLAAGKSLLVVDNFETPWFESASRDLVERVLQLLASVDTITLIITMRGNPAPSAVDWTMVLPSEGLGPLSPAAAKEMYLKLSKSKVMDVQSSQFLEMLLIEVDYIPLAVTLLAALGKTYPPEKLYARWKKNQTELLKAPGSQLTKQTSVSFSISLSLQSSTLLHNLEANRLLAILAFLPAGLPQWSDLIEEITAGFEDVYNAADVLCQTSLVTKTDNGNLSMLSPTRHFINSRKDLNIDNHTHDLGALVYFISESIKTKSPHLVLLGQSNIIHILTKWIEVDPSVGSYQLAYDCSEYLYEQQIIVRDLMELVIPILRKTDAQVLLADCTIHYCTILQRLDYIAEEHEITAVCEIYSKFGEEWGLARATDFLGFMFYANGQYEKAVEKHSLAYDMFKKLDHAPCMMACLQNWIHSLDEQQKFDEVMDKFQLIMEIAPKTPDNEFKAGCSVDFAEFLKRQKKFEESNQQYALAVDLYTSLGQKDKAAKYLTYMGINLYAMNELEQAIEKHQMAYKIYQELQIGPHPDICVVLMCLSTIWDAMGWINESLQAFATHYTMCEELLLKEDIKDHQRLMAKCARQYGMLLLRIGDYKEAIEKLTVAQELFAKLDDLDQAAICLDNIGVAFNVLGEYAQSVERHRAAYAIFEGLQEDDKMIECLKLWKSSLVAEDKYAEAYKTEMKAQVIWTRLDNQMQKAISLNYLGDFLCLQGKYSEAIQQHSKALDIFIQVGVPSSTAICLGSYWGRTCVMQKEYSEAIIKYTEAYDILSKVYPPATQTMANYLKEIAFCLEMEGNIAEAQAKYKAAEYLEIWNDWLDSWFTPPYLQTGELEE